jgi:hypothetical protein
VGLADDGVAIGPGLDRDGLRGAPVGVLVGRLVSVGVGVTVIVGVVLCWWDRRCLWAFR